MTAVLAASGAPASFELPAGTGVEVEISGVSRSFGSVAALDDVSLAIEPGQIAVLLGPSGSGKTTLLRAVAGIETVDAGTIRLGERVLSRRGSTTSADRRDLGMVFQDYALWPHMTVRDNVAFALRRTRIPIADRRARVDEVLGRVGLGEHGPRYPNELSGGQQQRVALARAIVANPSLLLFDEPLSNLDADLRERMRVEISTLVRESGATAIYITHDQSEAFALADVIAVVEAGRIVQVGSPESIFSHPATPFVARFTGISGGSNGTLRHLGDGRAVVDVSGCELWVTLIGQAMPGERVDVIARATALAIVPDGTRVDEAVHGLVEGTVIDSAYRGAGYDHVVESSLGRLTGVRDAQSHPRGSRCMISVAVAATFAFGNNR
ncbi:ABC transporter ATP-binding protein [Pseudolysinimonas kribbensis]|uniref:Spermidine/putrescine ABC transporter ATPase n=1 Tax=Pseudolysinimonas kribbensis TaxID=433641 RepID=A0ABQ6K7G4_9MICO|nr:ABC transporter ATP-binding protein [Pseudolysinimonas kribbensis]GMA94686.1 spermidine/putrescine ABC transporter ATPase [Pseudolysinimonas kribbensis]